MKMTKRAICLFLAAVMALALTIPAMAAPDGSGGTRTITLNAGEGKFTNGNNEYSVDVTDGTLPDVLPEPSRDGWDFVGWYTQKPTEGTEKVTGDGGCYYYMEVYKAQGTKVEAGGNVPAEAGTLYAYYNYRTVEFKMNANGWKNKFTALRCTRRLDKKVTAEDLIVINMIYDSDGRTINWPGAEFKGWWTRPVGGEQINPESMTFGELVKKLTIDNDVPTMYAHWSRNGFSEENDSQYYDVTTPATGFMFQRGIGMDHYVHYNEQLSYPLLVTSDNNGSLRDVKWTVSGDGSDFVTITEVNDGAGVTVQAKNGNNEDLRVAKITATLNGVDRSVYVHLGHQYGETNSEKPATCQHEGTKLVHCYLCKGQVQITLPKLAHNYALAEIIPATCTTAGYTIKTCSMCKEATITIPGSASPGHQYTETKKTTCGVTVITSTCTKCGHIEVKESGGPATHNWDPEYTVDKDATCISPGSRSRHCLNPDCPAVTDVEDIPASGSHSYGPWRITETPHYNKTGLQERTCTICGAKQTEILPEDDNVPGTYPGGGGGGGTAPAPSETPTPTPSETPSPSPEPSPEPGTTPAPSPVPVPVDPPKTENASGWSYDYDTGDYYYFVEGVPKANYWAKEEAASQWGYWYYVGTDGKLATGLQYIENSNGTGWYFLQPDTTNGCVGRMLTGWRWIGPEAGTGWFNTAHGGVNGQCTYTTEWGDYNASDNTWGKDHIAH